MSRSEEITRLAQSCGWMQVKLRPAETAGGDKEAWQAFVDRASENDLIAATLALESLYESGVRGWSPDQPDAFDIDRVTRRLDE